MTDERPTHIDLFSGIGGFALAAGWAGFRTVCFCERDGFCQSVLARHWPAVPITTDIHDFDGTQWRGAGLLTGGFPCQPFSQAGEQRGTEDDRHLWPEMFRVIKGARPRFVLAENVAGIVNMALDDVISDLESEGYSGGAVIVPACAVNAPHRRDRVWIVANASSEGLEGNERHGASGTQGEPDGHFAECRRGRAESGMGNVADGIPAGMAGQFDNEPDIPRTQKRGKQHIQKLTALGNAIVPQVAFEILKILMAENEIKVPPVTTEDCRSRVSRGETGERALQQKRGARPVRQRPADNNEEQ